MQGEGRVEMDTAVTAPKTARQHVVVVSGEP